MPLPPRVIVQALHCVIDTGNGWMRMVPVAECEAFP